VCIVANEANVSMLRDEKIRVVERQWIVPLTAFSARRIPSLAASLATHSGWRNQAIALIDLPRHRGPLGQAPCRMMSVMAMFRQEPAHSISQLLSRVDLPCL
jgi:hypothetical protein